MIEKFYQRLCIEPLLKIKVLRKFHPNFFTILACIFGVLTLPLIAFKLSYLAMITLLISGFLDTLDGSLARKLNLSSDKGAALDIVSDRLVESCVILGLFFFDPSTRALACLLMLISILLCITSFLIVGMFSQNSSKKSFYYSPGLIERKEAFLFFLLMLSFPSIFLLLAYFFSFLVIITALIRMVEFLGAASIPPP